MSRCASVVVLALMVLPWQLGCSTADVVGAHVLKNFLEDDPTVVKATVAVAPDVNPDARDRPSPIKLRYYLLSSPTMLQSNSFYDLKDQGRELLADDLRLYDEQIYKPGATTPFELALPPEKTLEDERLYFGVVAGYWRIDGAVWQAVTEIEVHDTTELEIRVGRAAVTLTPVD